MKILEYSEILEHKNLGLLDEILKRNQVICYPTDTLYGLGGYFLSETLIKRIDELKERHDLPYSVVVSDITMMEKLVATIPDRFQELSAKLVPGKFTFLFQASPEIPGPLLKNSRKIGIRIPALTNLIKLVKRLGMPLVSTSVNLSGEPPLNDPEIIQARFPEIDLLINKGPLPESRGSTILDFTVEPVVCIRKGDDFHRLTEMEIQLVDRRFSERG